ncbi:peroxiredoxin family protein [Spirosoma fluviale]|uniref:AhpC/TSA family protein n=1 Tax=Spirosoma fluviale TaxID=1597977 RepID=A0A286F8C4_9BACT|nr:redoxin domain-containing protein [Spirosoma fluviale]SOD79443.1 AhpC/TSA family protein [Spirosoma fluviale]
MRTYLKWGLPILIAGLIAYLSWGFTTKLHHKQKTAERIQTLPAFTAYTLNRSIVNSATIGNRPAVIVYFDPDCDHCQREADELRQKAALLNTAQVILLSSAPLPTLTTFAKAHQLHDLLNVQVAHMDKKTAYETFGFVAVPDVLIYHADGSLSKRFRGETSVEAIARHL